MIYVLRSRLYVAVFMYKNFIYKQWEVYQKAQFKTLRITLALSLIVVKTAS